MTVVCEPGRFIAGNAGYFLTSVLYEKFNKDKRFVIVDGAMNDLTRPSLYQARHKIFALSGGEIFDECKKEQLKELRLLRQTGRAERLRPHRRRCQRG